MVREIGYRCLGPVFVGEAGVRVCGKRVVGKSKGEKGGEEGWDVWIEKGADEEGNGASMAVRGSVSTEFVGDQQEGRAEPR